jgi:hypothetical protein
VAVEHRPLARQPVTGQVVEPVVVGVVAERRRELGPQPQQVVDHRLGHGGERRAHAAHPASPTGAPWHERP